MTSATQPFSVNARRLVAATSPLVVLAATYFSLPMILDAGSLLKYCLWLGSAVLALGVTGGWMGHELTLPRSMLRWGAFALGSLLAVWAWQRLAYVVLIPDQFLTYGYFLTPPGKVPRLLMMQLPLVLGSFLLASTFLAALVAGARSGMRWLLASVAFWWFAAFIIFVFPSFYLWAQGDAGIFV